MKLPLGQTDDPCFVSYIQLVITGLVQLHMFQIIEVRKIDNWFDHKWLSFSHFHSADGRRLSDESIGIVGNPPFAENRIVSCDLHWIDLDTDEWIELPYEWEFRYRCSAFVFYSGNSLNNGRGSLMSYMPVEHGERWIWYAGFEGERNWKVGKTKGISEREIETYAKNDGESQERG